jgi:cytochrome b subunit of formate dehydrogenase
VPTQANPRHTPLIRATHWITALCFLALLVSGIELVISHPRFYWGEDGNSMTPALFQIPIPASRPYVKTGYNYVLPDQNGWSRSLHFQTAWLLVFTGLLYTAHILRSGHLKQNLLPAPNSGPQQSPEPANTYNPLQRLTYLAVIFGLFPLMIWTGLAMSPALTAAYPVLVDAVGGQQSARTIHFFASVALVLFLAVHILMIIRAGFKPRVQAMITGQEQP